MLFINMSHSCDHKNCSSIPATQSVCQTVSEMDWERGIWNAASSGDVEKVTAFIRKSPNTYETVNVPDNSGYTALHYASRNGHNNICKLLLQNGAEINTQTNGKATPLHKASVGGHIETVKLLLQHGASPNIQDDDGQTALHKAVQEKHYQVAHTLLCASPSLKDMPDFKGNTVDIPQEQTN